MLGAHVSISGGVDKAPLNGKNIGCECVQIFTANQRQWMPRTLLDEEVDNFKSLIKKFNLGPTLSHDSYLINMASPEEENIEKSKKAFFLEMERCKKLELQLLNLHPGSHMGKGEEKGLETFVKNLNEVTVQFGIFDFTICIETTAGQGTNLGHSFEQIKFILDNFAYKEKIGVCFDTCHSFCAGYDLRDSAAYSKTFDLFEKVIGINKIKAFHLNDSKNPLNSRKDRHENIGKGFLGENFFKILVNDKNFKSIPMYLETPGGDEAYREDLKTLRALIS